MTIPGQPYASSAEEAKRKEVRRQLDFAYACFALPGFAMPGFMCEPFVGEKNQAAYAMSIGLLLLLPSLLALLLAICLTVMRLHHTPIVVFCPMSMLLLVLTFRVDAIGWVYGAVSVLVPMWWFTVAR